MKKTKGRKIILGPSHDYLSEQEAWIPNSKHWWGLASENGCPLLVEKQNSKDIEKKEKQKLIQRLVRLNFTYDYVCSACEDIKAYPQKRCPYKRQFKNLKSFSFVLAPIAYAFTKWISKYDPQEIVVDDCIMSKMVHHPKGLLEFQLQFLTNIANKTKDSTITLYELNNRPDYTSFIKKLKKAYKENINKLVEQAKDENWEKASSDYDEYFLVTPNEIETYCKLAKVHGYQEQFATPALFFLFDYVVEKQDEGKDVKLTVIDAKPDTEFLETLAERYYKERHVRINFVSDPNFEPTLADRGSRVYYMGKGWYPRKSIENPDTKKNIREMVEWVLYYFYDNNPNQKIGAIVWKPKNWQYLSEKEYSRRLNIEIRLFIPEKFKNVTIETHGNVRGKNSLEYCDPIFVFGAYVINKCDIEKQFIHWHGYKPKNGLGTVENESHGDYYHHVDEKLDAFCHQLEGMEVYQEIHRSRLWLSKKRVFVFGPKIKEIEEEGVKTEIIDINKIKRLNRKRWLEEFVRLRGKTVRTIFAEEKMVEEFKEINSTKWAYRVILKIVKKSEHLKLKGGVLFYE